MAFGSTDVPNNIGLFEIILRRRWAASALFAASREGRVKLFGSPDVQGDRSDEIPARYFDVVRNLGHADNSIATDLDRLSDTDFHSALDGGHQRWFNVRADGPSFVAWLRSLVLPMLAQERRGPKGIYDWAAIKAEFDRLMEYNGALSPDDPTWKVQADVERAVSDFCSNSWDRSPSESLIRQHVSEWLANWTKADN
jgi:hypothetical protein